MFSFLKNKNYSWYIVLAFLASAVFLIYNLSSVGKTPYDYFTRLGASFLQGKYYLTENPSWLNELVPIGTNRFAVVYPPGPALVAIPFILVFGQNFEQQLLAQIMGAVAALVWGIIAFKKSGSRAISFWVFLLTSLGNIIWFLASNGSSWYLGQVSAFMFLTLAIYESLNNKNSFLVSIYFGFAIISRLQVALAFPLIFYLNINRFKNIQKNISLFLGLIGFAVFYCLYNYLRFGSIFQTGYGLIPGVLNEPWYGGSLFSLSHISSNIKVMFASLPIIKNTLPYITPSWGGLAIWITTPAFIYLFGAKLKNKENIFAIISILLIAIVTFTHGGTGFTQFGYRYAVDFYPLILFLIVNSVKESNLKWHHWVLLTLSVLVNLWGVIFINKFGWVGW